MSDGGGIIVHMFEDGVVALPKGEVSAISGRRVDAAAPASPGVPAAGSGNRLEAPDGAADPGLGDDRDDQVAATARRMVAEFEALASLSALAVGDGRPLSDAQALDVIAGWAAIQAHAAAELRRWSAALAHRTSMSPDWLLRGGRVGMPSVAGDEIGMRLGVSRWEGARLIAEGEAFRGVLGEVGEALSSGVIDAGKARVFVDALAEQEPATALAVSEEVLPQASAMTRQQVAAAIQRAIIQVDPDGAAERHARAASRRRLERPRAMADGMARLTAVLTAAQAAGVWAACESAARAARAGGDGRTLEQLRADAISAMGAQALVEGRIGPATSVVRGAGQGAGAGTEDQRVAPPDDGAGAGTEDQRVAPPDDGGAVMGADQATSSAAGRGDENPVLEEPPAAAGEPGGTTLGQAGGIAPDDPAAASDDAVGAALEEPASEPDEPASEPDEPVGGFAFRPPGPARLARLESERFRFSGPASRLYLQIPLAVLQGEAQRGPAADIAEEIDDLLADMHGAPPPDRMASEGPGSDDLPGTAASPGMAALPEVAELVGYGALDPATARMLAAEGGMRVVVWDPVEEARRRASAVPRSRTPWDVGRECHDPPAALTRFVRLRDPTCVGTGCTVPSSSCDIDHVIEFPLGPTDAWNLRPLCRRHHLLKTHAGHRLTIEPDGSLTWSSPLGQELHRSTEGRWSRQSGLRAYAGTTRQAASARAGGAAVGLGEAA
ncbi:HNH endonuclease [Beutenbergia cavernae]|uniref:HNH endonuclease signature motif containing protein n=1 Tax=Beutenbergia cavernae TaxID=84757 RepID=UPI00019AD8B8|nr:DUF222 domain-containing protein [Beutenbergia cavernae]